MGRSLQIQGVEDARTNGKRPWGGGGGGGGGGGEVVRSKRVVRRHGRKCGRRISDYLRNEREAILCFFIRR